MPWLAGLTTCYGLVVITWRAGRAGSAGRAGGAGSAHRSRVSWNSQQLVFVCPLYQSYKSKMPHKHIPIFERKDQN